MRRAPVLGPDGAPEASRDVIASHAAGAALPAPALPVPALLRCSTIKTPHDDAPG
jgi:hypothetical protein